MVKAEWGTKRTCPKCAARFYDLGKEDPVTCINSECGYTFVPEPVLKSKQPMPFEAVAAVKEKEKPDEDLAADELAIDEDEEPSADDEVDLSTGDDDLGVETSNGEDEEN
ncbi:MAG TPA: TIGR02300 family protein [Sphingomicrobium sp.]|nr:TIGR02300 family protein [Sphingomicrobium sp.]